MGVQRHFLKGAATGKGLEGCLYCCVAGKRKGSRAIFRLQGQRPIFVFKVISFLLGGKSCAVVVKLADLSSIKQVTK
jgi:hypothetical protein